jgi:hypothetical protein
MIRLETLLPGSSEWDWVGCVLPSNAGIIPDALRDALPSSGREAARAVIGPDTDIEVLASYSVWHRAKQLSGKATITLNLFDQLCLAIARQEMGLSTT